MRAIECCPICVDALDAYGDDGPRIGSPIDGSGSGPARRLGESGGVWNDALDDDAGRRESATTTSVSVALSALKRRSRTLGTVSRGGVSAWMSASARDVSVRAPAKPRRESRAPPTTMTTASGMGFVVRSSSVDFSPLSRPEHAIEGVINALEDVNGDVEWEERLRAVELAHRLVLHHQRVVSARLRPFIVAAVTGVESLRSCVARASLSLVKTMVSGFHMDTEVDYVLPSVLKRAAEMNFLSHDANEILHLLAKHVSPIALIRALRRQASTRRLHSKVAMCLALCVEEASSGTFRGRQGCVTLDHALDTLEHCLKSGNRNVREYAKRCLRGIREATNADGWDKATKRFPELCAEFDEF